MDVLLAIISSKCGHSRSYIAHAQAMKMLWKEHLRRCYEGTKQRSIESPLLAKIQETCYYESFVGYPRRTVPDDMKRIWCHISRDTLWYVQTLRPSTIFSSGRQFVPNHQHKKRMPKLWHSFRPYPTTSVRRPATEHCLTTLPSVSIAASEK